MTKATATTAAKGLSDLDREALERAIAIDRKRSKACRQQIDDKLRDGEPWLEVAQFCAHRCQEIALHLKPWECWPPCRVEPDDTDRPSYERRGIGQSAALLRRMLSLGVSKFDPDPVGAVTRAEMAAGR